MSHYTKRSFNLSGKLKLAVLPLILLTLLVIAVFETSPSAPDTAFYNPGGIYGDHWDSVKYEPFSGGRWGAIFSILLLGHFFITHLIGYQMVRPWLAMSQVPFGIKLCASFIPGYLALTGINRIITLCLPNTIAPPVCLGASLLLYYVISKNNNRTQEIPVPTDNLPWKQIATLVGVYIVSILVHIQWGRVFMVSDSTGNTFLPILTQLIERINEVRYFPLVDQQYDEFTFSYPINFLPPGRHLLIVPYWWLASIGKVSLCAALWVILTSARNNEPLSLIPLVGAPFLVLSGLVPNPLKYVELTGCMLPIIDGWHIGRLLGPVLPFLILGLLFEKTADRPRPLGILLLGIGIGTTSIHNTLFTLGTVVVGVLWFYIKPLRIAPSLWRFIAITGATATLMSILFTYSSSSANPPYHNGWPLIFGTALSSICLILRPRLDCIPDAETPSQPKANFSWLILIAGIFLSVGFLGNLPSKKIITALRSAVSERILPGGYQLTIQRASNLANIDAPKQYFRFAGNRSPSKHALSFSIFLGYYGLFFICAFTLLGMWVYTLFSKPTTPESEYHLQLILFFAATLALAFFCVDFILDAILPWIKYRLIEIPFIGILILILKKANELSSHRQQLAIAIALTAWTVPAFFMHAPIEQLLSNIKYLLTFF